MVRQTDPSALQHDEVGQERSAGCTNENNGNKSLCHGLLRGADARAILGATSPGYTRGLIAS